MKTGVYQIRNLVNSKCYIGSVADKRGFQYRWGVHRSKLDHSNHHSVKFQNAWNKYGVDAFIFEILEECESLLCIEREQYYLDTLLFAYCDDHRFDLLGYNICRRAGSTLGYRHSNDTRAKIRNFKLGIANPSARLNEDDVRYIRSCDINIKQLASKFNISVRHCQRIRSGERWSHVR